jgi:hypothetical protein
MDQPLTSLMEKLLQRELQLLKDKDETSWNTCHIPHRSSATTLLQDRDNLAPVGPMSRASVLWFLVGLGSLRSQFWKFAKPIRVLTANCLPGGVHPKELC